MTTEETAERDMWRDRAWKAEALRDIARYDIGLLVAMAKPRGLKDDPTFMRIANWHAQETPMATTLRWVEGPSRGGEGTAGKDSWWDGDTLLVVIELSGRERETHLVHVSADEYVSFNDPDGNDIGWGPEAISWYANLEHALPYAQE